MSSAPDAVLDLSDLVQEAIDEPRSVSARPHPDGGSGTSKDSSVPHQFCLALLKLLTDLHNVFEEKDELKGWISFMKAAILDNPGAEVWALEKWHKEMTTHEDGTPRVPNLYVLTRERRIEEVFDAKVWVFEEIDGRGLYNDPDLFPEDREKLCKHFDRINALAQLHATLPPEMVKRAEAIGATHDPTQPVTLETIQGVVQQIIGCGPTELGRDGAGMERILGWARHLTAGLSTDMPSDEDGVLDAEAMLESLTAKGGIMDSLSTMMGDTLGSSGISLESIVKTATAEVVESRRLVSASLGSR
jgi:hypothetical protein